MTPINTTKYRLAIHMVTTDGTNNIYVENIISNYILTFTDSKELSMLFNSKLEVSEFYKRFETQITDTLKDIENALGTVISTSINIETILCTFEELNVNEVTKIK